MTNSHIPLLAVAIGWSFDINKFTSPTVFGKALLLLVLLTDICCYTQFNKNTIINDDSPMLELAHVPIRIIGARYDLASTEVRINTCHTQCSINEKH